MSKQPATRVRRDGSDGVTQQQMKKSLRDLILLCQATGLAVRRRLHAGQSATARRLASHLRFLTKLVAALRAEIAA